MRQRALSGRAGLAWRRHGGGRALDVLIVLAQRAGQLVRRNELIDLAWPGLVVEENNLSVQGRP